VPDVPVQIQASTANGGPAEALQKRAPVVYGKNPAFDKLDCLGRNAPRWNALESDSNATLIKTGRQRKVWRVVMPHGQCVYAKVFDDPVGSATHLLKRILRLHPAIREWRALMQLQTLGVPAVRPIALAKYAPNRDLAPSQRGGAIAHRFVLLTAGIENAVTLISAFQTVRRELTKRHVEACSLSAAVSGLWADAHDRGYAHPDGHPGNVLIANDGSNELGAAHAVFIDPARSMYSTLRQKPVSTNKALMSLAMLDHYFHRSATCTERLRFWRDYWLRREVLLDDHAERRLFHRLAQYAAVHRVALARQRDRRLRGDGKYFGKVELSGGWAAKVVLQLERPHVFQEIDIPNRTPEEWASLCKQLLLRVHHDRHLALKGIRLVRRPVDHRGPWAEPLFHRCHRLRHRDVSAPLVLGYMQNRKRIGIRDEYLILPAMQLGQSP
jgi:hypothetical protein